MRPLILRKQSSLHDEIKTEVGDPATGGLWSSTSLYTALNRAISKWAGKVQLPRLYSFATDFDNSTFAYAVPLYIRGDIEVQIRTTAANQIEEDDGTTWASIPAGFLEPSGTGDGAVFRWHSLPYAAAGRVRWWADNGPVPVTVPGLSAGITSADTTIVVDAAVRCGDAGWVCIDGEYISYAGVTRGASTTTLNNCERGLYSSAAASHLAAADVEWAVAVDDERLWEQLIYQTISNLHSQKLHRGTEQDRQQHQEMVNWGQTMADRFWAVNGYVPQRQPRAVLSQIALGRTPWY